MPEPHPDSARTTLAPNDLPGRSADTPAAGDLAGLVVDGQFRLVSAIGAGGMGTVWLAEQLGVGRRVVLKFLNRGGNAAAVERFRREARAVATLNHPNIVQIYVTGEAQLPVLSGRRMTGGLTPYLAMEHVDGVTLRAAARHPMPAERAIHIAEQIVAALVAAHGAGIVHRDLKPENVMLTERWGELDVVKVLDFGIAKLTHGTSPALTQAGAVFGTPRYMSPEQAKGEAADARSDLYTVGIMLYELLCGAPPFTDESALELMAAHATAPVPLPSQAFPGAQVTPAVERLLLRTLQKQPQQRFGSAVELREALRALLPHSYTAPARSGPAAPALSGAVTLEAPPPVTPRAARSGPKRRALQLAAGGGLLTLVAVMVVRARQVEHPPQPNALTEAPAVGATPPQRPPQRADHVARRGPEPALGSATAAAAGRAVIESSAGRAAVEVVPKPLTAQSLHGEAQPLHGEAQPLHAQVHHAEAPTPTERALLEPVVPDAATADEAPDPFDTLANQLVGDALGVATSALLGGKPAPEQLAALGVYPGAKELRAVGPTATYGVRAPIADVIRWYDARWSSARNVIRLKDVDSKGAPRLILSGALNPALPFFSLVVSADEESKGSVRINCVLRPGAR